MNIEAEHMAACGFRRAVAGIQRSLAVLLVAFLAVGILPGPCRGEDAATVFVIAGDSISAGCCAGDSRSTLQHLLENRSHGQWTILNHSYGGDGFSLNPYTGHLPEAFEIWATGGTPIIMLGTNDYARSMPLADFSLAYQTFVNSILYRRDRVYCVTPIWRLNENGANAIGLTLQDYRDAIVQVCATVSNAATIDGTQLVPNDPAFFVDGLHPNARGFTAMARALARMIRPTLPSTPTNLGDGAFTEP